MNWTLVGVAAPHNDILYFLENKEIENIRLRQGQNFSTYLEIEIPHKSVDEKNNQIIKKLETILKDYNNKILTRLNNETNIKLEKFESLILENKDSASAVINVNAQISNLLTQKELFIERLKSNQLYIFDYDGVINIKKAKRLMVKNLLISFTISIILIILSLWIKLFIREINKNSK